MVDAKLTALSATTSSTGDDLIYIVDDPSGTPASYKITKDNFFKFTDGGVIYDANGNEILKILKTSSAVNEIEIQNGATGNPAVIRASGETNIGILLTGKGTGKIQVGDAADPTKKLTIELVGATTAKTTTLTFSHTDDRTITFPDATDTLVGKATTDTLTNKTLTAPKFADLGFIADPSGNELIIFDQTTTAVNEITVVNNSTGVNPIIKASGETNVGLQLSPKGSGKITVTDGTDLTKKADFNVSGVTTGNTRTLTIPDFDGTLATLAGTETLSGKTLTAPKFADLGFIADANGNELIILDTVASAVNELTLANAATGNAVTVSTTGGDSNIDCKLSPKGSGTFYGNRETFSYPLTDETTLPTTGVKYVTEPFPYAFTLEDCIIGLTTAGTGATLFSVDVLLEDTAPNTNTFTTIFSTKPTIDASEFTSTTAATPMVLSATAIAKGKRLQLKIHALDSNSLARGVKISLIGHATAR